MKIILGADCDMCGCRITFKTEDAPTKGMLVDVLKDNGWKVGKIVKCDNCAKKRKHV